MKGMSFSLQQTRLRVCAFQQVFDPSQFTRRSQQTFCNNSFELINLRASWRLHRTMGIPLKVWKNRQSGSDICFTSFVVSAPKYSRLLPVTLWTRGTYAFVCVVVATEITKAKKPPKKRMFLMQRKRKNWLYSSLGKS